MASIRRCDKGLAASAAAGLVLALSMASATAKRVSMADTVTDLGVIVGYSNDIGTLPYKPITSGSGRWDKDLDEMDKQLNESRSAWGSVPFDYPDISNNWLDISDTPGWSWDLTLKADYDPEPFTVPVDNGSVVPQLFFKTGGMLNLQTPTSKDGSALSVDDEWNLCLLRWDLGPDPDRRPDWGQGFFNEKLRTDDGTCSSALSEKCIDALTERVQNRFTADGTCSCTRAADVPECAADGDDADPWNSRCHATKFGASEMAAWAGGRHHVFAYTTGGWYSARQTDVYNDLGSVAWPVMAVLSGGDARNGTAYGRSRLSCVRATHAADGWEVPSLAAKNTTEAGRWGDEEEEEEEPGKENAAAGSRVGPFGPVFLALLSLTSAFLI